MKKMLFALLLLAFAAFGQQDRVAIINTVDNLDSIHFTDLAYLTNRLRETAVNVLPKELYGVMTTESIVAFLGSQENAIRVCREASCIAEIGRKVSADYVAQGRIGRFNGKLTINFELYSSKSGNLLGSFTGSSMDLAGLLAIIDEHAPVLFKKMPGVEKKEEPPPPPVEEVKDTVPVKSDRFVSFGLRAGFNFSHVYTKYYTNEGTYDDIAGMQLGAVLDIAVAEWFHFLPGIMYIQKGMKDDRAKYSEEDITAHYFEIPWLLSIKSVVLPFRLNVGPYIGLCLASGDKNIFGSDLGFSGGFGFDIEKFYVGMFYDYGFVDMGGKKGYSFYNRSLGFNLGYNL